MARVTELSHSSNDEKSATMRTILIAALALTLAGCSPDSSSKSQAAAEASTSDQPEDGAAIADWAELADAEAFLREVLAIYASPSAYAAAQEDVAAQAEKGTPAEMRRLFTPALAKRLISNSATTDDIGIGFDPICMCNDDSALAIRSISSVPQADGGVLSTVSFDSFDASGENHPALILYSLEKMPAGWRISEVVDRRTGEGDVSLVQTLALK